MNKGDYGYMNSYKKRHLIAVAIFAAVILALVIVGRMELENNISIISYVLGVVLVLPAAKHVIAVIVVAQYHTLNEQSIEDLDEHTRLLKNGISLYDVTLASESSIAFAPYMYLFQSELYCLIQITSKVTADGIKTYLEQILRDAGISLEVTMVKNISEMNRILEGLQDQEECNIKKLENAKKQILVYNV